MMMLSRSARLDIAKCLKQGVQDLELSTVFPLSSVSEAFGFKWHFPYPGLILLLKPWRCGICDIMILFATLVSCHGNRYVIIAQIYGIPAGSAKSRWAMRE